MSELTVIGLGAMGSSLVTALLDGGQEVAVWNRSRWRATPLEARGARWVDSVEEALASSPVCIICVLDYAAARSILAQAPKKLSGRTVVNLTNGTPAQARELERWVKSLGARYLDGAIMVTPEHVGREGAFVLYSGDEAAYTGNAPTLARFGEAVYLGADVSLAAVQDLAFLSAMFGLFSGYLHAAALLRSQRISVTQVTPGIVAMLEAMLGLLAETATEIDTGRYPVPSSNNRMMAAALANIVAGSSQQGVHSDLVRPIHALFARGVDADLGDLDISALVPLLASHADAAE